jgi:F-type H+-transporting ATPase subunit b
VRYEGQVKERQQRELADAVMAKITKELENPKILQQILQQSVTDVESKFQLYPTYIGTILTLRIGIVTSKSQ